MTIMSPSSRTLPSLWGAPCYILPILAGLAWFITLASFFIAWMAKGSPHYAEMWPSQHLAYISNAAASDWGRPLFISGSIITAILFSVTFATERRLRHRKQLLHCSNKLSTISWTAAAILTAIATIALILFPIFCVRGHPIVHYSTVAIFALGYIFATTLICIEKQQICHSFPSHNLLRRSLQIKIFFIIVEILLVVLGSVTMYKQMYQSSVMIEWVASLLFSFYMASFAIDFMVVPGDGQEKSADVVLSMVWDEEAGIKRPRRIRLFGQKGYVELE